MIKMPKKTITFIAALSMLLGTHGWVQAVDYQYDEDWGYCYVENNMDMASEQDPFNNDLFEVVAEVQSDRVYADFETYDYEYTEDYTQCRIIKRTVGYDGMTTEEFMTDYMDNAEAEKIMDTYNGWAEYRENGYKESYNDGLVRMSYNERMWPYTFNDINGVNYIFNDPAWMGYGVGYNIGLMQESWSEEIYVEGQDFPDWGDSDTYLYTIFSDDVNYKFIQTDFTIFDDNGYSIMKVDGKQYVVKLKKGFIPTVFYNGEKIKFDQIPVIDNGRTLVPLRAIFEKIGAQVEWDGETQTVTATKDDVTVSLTIDNTQAVKNGEEITLDVPAKIINGRTLVPVRFISDCFGVDVAWDGTMQRVTLTSK